MSLHYVTACKVCGRVYVSPYKRGMYCGALCKDRAYRGLQLKDKTCPVCGTVFRTFDTKQHYCSAKCRNEDKRRRNGVVDKTCIVCGKPLPRRPGGHKTCSAECMEINRLQQKRRWAVLDWQRQKGKPKPPRTTYERTCPECGDAFTTDNTTKVYCSQHCASVAKHKRRNRRRPFARTCRMCGKEFQTERPYQVCCSRRCSMLWQHALGVAPKKGHDKLQVFESPCAAADEDDMIYGNMVYF